MPRRGSVEEALGRLRAISDPNSSEARQEITAALASGSGLLTERAATIIGDAELEGFEASLQSAFDRLIEAGADADAGCGGKIAIVRALNKLRLPAEDVFLKAARHRQPEYSGDTAVELRAAGVIALAETSYREMAEVAVDLLADREAAARLGAVRALATDGSRSSLLLLRMKARLGDREVDVVDECLRSLLERDPRTLAFVASFLDGPYMRVAALVLGDSRRAEAFAYLKAALDEAPEGESQALLLAMAMLRTDESLDLLFGLLDGRDIALAEQAYQALCVYEDDPDLKKRLVKAVKASKYRRLFEGPRRNWTE